MREDMMTDKEDYVWWVPSGDTGLTYRWKWWGDDSSISVLLNGTVIREYPESALNRFEAMKRMQQLHREAIG